MQKNIFKKWLSHLVMLGYCAYTMHSDSGTNSELSLSNNADIDQSNSKNN